MKMELPSPVLHSLFMLNEAGYEAFVVGGCVRDALMGTAPSDWDITTSALPEETLAVFADFRTIETGIKHGTVTVIVEDVPLEITTYRIDGTYSDGRHPDAVAFSRSIREDLKRRDFTVNAMAYHPKTGLVDPFCGRLDLKKHVIRCVGKPKRRFSEDALRILRGLRFSTTLGFSIHPATAKAIHRLGHTLTCVSAERNAAEFCKLICGKDAETILNDYADVLSYVLSDVDYREASKAVGAVPSGITDRLTTLLLHLSPDAAETACGKLCMSKKITDDVTTLVRNWQLPINATRRCVLQTLHALGPQLTNTFICLKKTIEHTNVDGFQAEWSRLIEANDCCYQIQDLALNGADLMASGIPHGPKIGLTLNHLLTAVMDGACPNEKEQLLKYATKKPVQ